MCRQIVFKPENIEKLTISPYTEIYGKGTNRILFYRRDTNQRLLLESDQAQCLSVLLECFEHGVKRDDLAGILASMEAAQGKKWIDVCIAKGVVE